MIILFWTSTQALKIERLNKFGIKIQIANRKLKTNYIYNFLRRKSQSRMWRNSCVCVWIVRMCVWLRYSVFDAGLHHDVLCLPLQGRCRLRTVRSPIRASTSAWQSTGLGLATRPQLTSMFEVRALLADSGTAAMVKSVFSTSCPLSLFIYSMYRCLSDIQDRCAMSEKETKPQKTENMW